VGQGAVTGAADRPVLAGRVAELGAVEQFLATGAAGRMLVVCGDPGIGKSTVWEAGVGLARSRGFAVWSARPGEAEAQLSFAGLGDLLEGADGGVLAGLPVPQRRALVALAWARVLRGRAVDDLIARSEALPPGTANLYEGAVDRPAGVRLAFRGELAAAREVFQRLLAAAEQRGEARSGVVFIGQLCEVELRAGDAIAAATALDELDQWTALEPEGSVFAARAGDARGGARRPRARRGAVGGDSPGQ